MIKVCANGHITGFRNCPQCYTTMGEAAAHRLREKRLNSTPQEWMEFQMSLRGIVFPEVSDEQVSQDSDSI